ncbi:MAG: hypothetical protein ACLQVW_12520 [Limisphaerales bacterium]
MNNYLAPASRAERFRPVLVLRPQNHSFPDGFTLIGLSVGLRRFHLRGGVFRGVVFFLAAFYRAAPAVAAWIGPSGDWGADANGNTGSPIGPFDDVVSFYQAASSGTSHATRGLILARPGFSSGGRFRFQSDGAAWGSAVQVQAAVDLTNWIQIGQTIASGRGEAFTDSNTNLQPGRFYRALSNP